MHRCLGPCVAKLTTKTAYDEAVEQARLFLAGRTEPLLKRVKREMWEAAEAMDYERAAQLRDTLAEVEAVSQRRKLSSVDEEDLDVYGVHISGGNAAVVSLIMREGQVLDRRELFWEGVGHISPELLLSEVVPQIYDRTTFIPKEIHLPVPIEDEEVSAELQKALRKRGIDVMTGTKMLGVDRTEGGVRLRLEGGKTDTVEAELLLVAIGRRPVTENLNLEALGVKLERGYVHVNPYMQTAVPNIYAIGDVINTPWLAHVASAEGILAVEHMAGQAVRPINYDRVPSCTYCDPEVASVGLTEAKARERGYDVKVGKFPFTALGKAKVIGKTTGFVKVIREAKYDEILGVHIIGAHATDLIAEACVALQMEGTDEELLRTMHAHPTMSEAVMEAAHAAHGAAIHM
jgi:dihydrolipoamide dehydrogenase